MHTDRCSDFTTIEVAASCNVRPPFQRVGSDVEDRHRPVVTQPFTTFPPMAEPGVTPVPTSIMPGSSAWGVPPFMGIPNDPSLMGVMTPSYGQFGFMGGPPTDPNVMGSGLIPASLMPAPPIRHVLKFDRCALYPPRPNISPPPTRTRPPGCRTVFVGGLPENVTEEIIKEVFSDCGEISIVRMSKKNFCHIRFQKEIYVDNAIALSGYRMKIGDEDDAPNTGRLHVDYAQARDDQHEWECKQRAFQREQRHRDRVEQERLQASSPVPVVYYSEHDSAELMEKLKNEKSFQKAVQTLSTWLDRGECNKRNAGHFYSMLQTTHSHLRRLLAEKKSCDEELSQTQLLLSHGLQGILVQFGQIEKVFRVTSHQKVWDHFTKAQRKNIDLWRKQVEESKSAHLAEVLDKRQEDEMELSDDENFPPDQSCQLDESDEANSEASRLREEIDTLRCQVEAYKNEADLLRAETQQEKEIKDQQMKLLQQALQGIQQQRSKDQEELKKLKEEAENSFKNSQHEKSNLRNKEGSPPHAEVSSSITLQGVPVSEKDAKLIALISVFLHAHPLGASLDYIWSYTQMFEPGFQPCDIEMLLSKFPFAFPFEVSGVGATLERKWKFAGFKK